MLTVKGPLLPQERLLIVYFIAILLFFMVFAIIIVIAFQKRKNKFLVERFEAQQRYEKELADSQIEIQEQTLKNIVWELHDNVGQMLSVAHIQLNLLMQKAPDAFHEQIQETQNVVTDTVQEIRSLSKVLNNDVILKNGLLESLKVELNRFNKLNFLDASYGITGDIVPIKSANEIIIFRIIQEFLSNVIKHAKATELCVHLDYQENNLQVTVTDNGVGFDTQQKTTNSGMETMQSRTNLLNAAIEITSGIGEGSRLFLKYPYTIA